MHSSASTLRASPVDDMTQHQYNANDWQYDRDHGSGSTYFYMFTTALADRRGKLYFAVFMLQ